MTSSIIRLGVAIAALFYCSVALAQNSGTATSHAFAVGKGAGKQGFSSVLCTLAQVPIGQTTADPICRTLAGDVTIDGTGATVIGANKITNALFRQSGPLALVGRSANTTGNVADIQATAGSSCVFLESASSLTCATIATANITNNAVTFAKFQQLAALSMFGNCTNALANGAAVTGTANQVLRVNGAGTSCAFGAIDLSQAAAATGTLQTASVPAFAGGDVTGAGGSLVLTIGANAVTNAKMATMAANTVKGNASGGSAVPTDVAPATARSSSLLNIDQMTTHGDSIYTILSTDRVVATSAAFSASRAWTLPAANVVNAGQSILITDLAGGVTASNTLVITRAGADTINGGTAATITAANGAYYLVSDGSSKWTAQSMGAASGGGVTSVTCGTGLSGGTITTSGTCAVSLTSITNSLGTNAAIATGGGFVDGPSIAQGTSGTWWASGGVTITDTAGNNFAKCKLWDGTTVIDSRAQYMANASSDYNISLSGPLASPVANIKISCSTTAVGATTTYRFNDSGASKDSTVSAHRIQ